MDQGTVVQYMGRIVDGLGHAARDVQVGKVVDGISSDTLSRDVRLGIKLDGQHGRSSVSDGFGSEEKLACGGIALDLWGRFAGVRI